MTTLTDEDLAPGAASQLPAPSRPDGPGRGPRVIPLKDLWERTSLPLVRSVVVSVVLALAAAGAGVAVKATATGIYRSQATLLMDEPGAIAASADAGVVQKLSALRAKYAALALTAPVLDAAAQASGLPVAVVGGATQVGFPANDLTLQVSGVSPDPRNAQRVAQSVAESLSGFASSEQAATGVPPREQVAISVIDPAGPAVKTSPTTRNIALTGLVAGVVVLVLAYLVAQLAWTRPRRL